MTPRSSPNVSAYCLMFSRSMGYMEWRIFISALSKLSCDPNDDAESIPFDLR